MSDFFFYQVAIKSLSVKVIFEKSPEGSEGVSHRDTCGINITGEETARTKTQECSILSHWAGLK